MSALLVACGGNDLKNPSELDLICESGIVVPDSLPIISVHVVTGLEQLELTLATAKENYTNSDACIPFYLTVTNTGDEPLVLTEEQIEQLNDINIGFYRQSGLRFQEDFYPSHENSILDVMHWPPGEQLEFSAITPMDRIEVYTPPRAAYTPPGAAYTEIIWGASLRDSSASFDIRPVQANVTVENRVWVAPIESSPMLNAFVPGQLLVAFEDSVNLKKAEEIIAANDSYIVKTLSSFRSGIVLVDIPPDKTTQEMIDYFKAIPEIRSAERNHISGIP